MALEETIVCTCTTPRPFGSSADHDSHCYFSQPLVGGLHLTTEEIAALLDKLGWNAALEGWRWEDGASAAEREAVERAEAKMRARLGGPR